MRHCIKTKTAALSLATKTLGTDRIDDDRPKNSTSTVLSVRQSSQVRKYGYSQHATERCEDISRDKPEKITKKRPSSAKDRRKAATKLAKAAKDVVSKAVVEQGDPGEGKDEEEEAKQPDKDQEMGEGRIEPSQTSIGHQHPIHEFKLGHAIVTAMHEAHFQELSKKKTPQQTDILAKSHTPNMAPFTLSLESLWSLLDTQSICKENKEHYMGIRDAEYYGGEKNEASHGPFCRMLFEYGPDAEVMPAVQQPPKDRT
ncbi:hypothetical protein BKA64DRAFT_764832 [Cadophora sp. MPI-SDFR-AT-0126]|nr:hypothetical protein BKA64DRAFT_764832 [Leotiomycetes sp. MPI-SDFR-AT-0126]